MVEIDRRPHQVEVLSPFNSDRLRYGVEVFFTDADSTFLTVESGNMMLTENGVFGDQYTTSETNGHMTFLNSFTERYNAGKLRRCQVEQFGSQLGQYLMPNARESVEALRFLDKQVHIVSGGIHQMFASGLQHLGIPMSNIHAIPLIFDIEGNYLGFDLNHVLLQDDGKARVVEQIVGKNGTQWGFAGDGNGDQTAVLKARTHFSGLSIAFAGIAKRKWMEDAPIQINCADFSPLLPLVTGVESDWPRLMNSKYQAILLNGFRHVLNGKIIFRSDYSPYFEAVQQFVQDNLLVEKTQTPPQTKVVYSRND